jgi:phosphopantetheinyl transferase
MPIFFQQDIDAATKLGVWEIDEEEDFFLQSVSLQRTISHSHKRLQHLAGRYLLKFLFPDFPLELIQLAETRKPFLEDEAFHFSISHSGKFAAVLVSRWNRVGVDIETVSPKAGLIRHKFLSASEEEIVFRHMNPEGGNETFQPQPYTLLWSCKESVFKWDGLGGMDFRKHMQIVSVAVNDNELHTVILLKKNEEVFLDIHSRYLGGTCLSYVIT